MSCDLDSPVYDDGAEEEGQPGQEEGSGSRDEAVDRGPGVGSVAAVPGREGPGLHDTNQQGGADEDTQEPHQGYHDLHPPDLPVNLPVLGGGAEVLPEGHGSVDDEDHEGQGVDHGQDLHQEGVALADYPAQSPGLSEKVASTEADVEDGLHEATDSQLQDEDVVRDPPQGEGGANRGDEDHVGREGDEEDEEEKESSDDFSGESVGGGGR